MTQPVQIPDPIYERLSDESDAQDVARGAIIAEWMNKADGFDSILSGRKSFMHTMSELRGLIDDLYIQAQHARIDEDIPDEYAEMQRELADKLDELTVGEQQ
jgi:hypothetical protein